MAQFRAKFGSNYKGMSESQSARLIMDLFGDKMGMDDGRTVYSRDGARPIDDYEVGRYTPGKGAEISGYLRNGTPVPDRYLTVIKAHEGAHERGEDEAGAMFYELRADPETALKIWSWRAAFAEAGESSKDADIFKAAEGRYRGTNLEPVLAAVKQKGRELVATGAYADFRAYETGIDPASINMN